MTAAPFRAVLLVSTDELEALVFAVEAAGYRGRPMPTHAQGVHVMRVYARAKALLACERVCAACGCTDEVACEGGCQWVAPNVNLCSRCFRPNPVAPAKRAVPAKARKKGRR
jgi:hypothetical protein